MAIPGFCNTLLCRLVVFGILVSLIPLVVISFLGLRTGQRGIEVHTAKHLDSVAALKQEAVEAWIDEQVAMAMVVLESLADSPQAGKAASTTDVPFRWESARLIDGRTGSLVAGTGRSVVLPPEGASDFIFAASQGRVVEYLQRRDGSGGGTLRIAQPAAQLRRDLVVVLEIDAGELSRLLRPDEGLSPGGRVYLVEDALEDPLITVDRAGIVRPSSVSVKRVEPATGLFTQFGDGERRMVARSAKISGTPWSAVVALPAATAFADVTSGRVVVAFGAIFTTLASAVLAAVLGLGLTSPLSGLAARVRAYRMGDPFEPLRQSSASEINDLTEAFNRMGTEIYRQNAALLEANVKLEAADEAKNTFLAAVTHELKTPLTAITAFGDILSRNKPGNLDERQVDQLNVISRNARRLDMLVNDLLDVSRIESGRLELRPTQVDVTEFVEEVRGTFEPMIDGARQHLSVSVHGKMREMVDADRTRLFQVLMNLLSNASKYSPPEGKISLDVDADGERVWFTVRDSGIGISETDQAKLFTSFFRADNPATRRVSGTGLGLVIARQLVRLYGGELTLRSKPGSGTEVSFFIPRGSPALQPEKRDSDYVSAIAAS